MVHPGVRERAAAFGGFHQSGDRGGNWKPGDSLSVKCRLYAFTAKDIPDFLHHFMVVRKAITGPNRPRNLVPMSKLHNTIVPRFKARWMTVPAGCYYAVENGPDFQLGWVSGFMQTPMLAIDDAAERRAWANRWISWLENSKARAAIATAESRPTALAV